MKEGVSLLRHGSLEIPSCCFNDSPRFRSWGIGCQNYTHLSKLKFRDLYLAHEKRDNFLGGSWREEAKNVFNMLAWWLYIERTYLMKDLNQGWQTQMPPWAKKVTRMSEGDRWELWPMRKHLPLLEQTVTTQPHTLSTIQVGGPWMTWFLVFC